MKVIFALPTSSAYIKIFEKTLSGAFSCVNTRLGCDTEILLPNLKQLDFNKMTIDESIHAFKRDNLKVCCGSKLDGEKNYSEHRVITKILKLDENNQHGLAMTKPMAVGSTKEKTPDWVECNVLLEKVTLDDKTRHLFIVDIEFDYENVDAKQIIYNEIYPPVIDKQTKLDANERLIFQLYDLYSKTTEKEPKSYKKLKNHTQLKYPKKII